MPLIGLSPRIRIAVSVALAPYEPGPLPGIRVFVSDSYSKQNESRSQASTRIRRTVDDAVRKFIGAKRLATAAVKTEVIILDTVKPGLLDVQVVVPEEGIWLAKFALINPNQPHASWIVADGAVLGGVKAEPPAIQIPVASVSRRHAIIAIEGRKVTLADLGSSHGTFVEGKRLADRPVTLSEGVEIKMGGALLRFVGVERSA